MSTLIILLLQFVAWVAVGGIYLWRNLLRLAIERGATQRYRRKEVACMSAAIMLLGFGTSVAAVCVLQYVPIDLNPKSQLVATIIVAVLSGLSLVMSIMASHFNGKYLRSKREDYQINQLLAENSPE